LGQAVERTFLLQFLAGWQAGLFSGYMRAVWPAASFVDGLVKEQPQGKCGGWGVNGRQAEQQEHFLICLWQCNFTAAVLRLLQCILAMAAGKELGHIFAAHFGIIKAFSYRIFLQLLFVSFSWHARTAQNFD